MGHWPQRKKPQPSTKHRSWKTARNCLILTKNAFYTISDSFSWFFQEWCCVESCGFCVAFSVPKRLIWAIKKTLGNILMVPFERLLAPTSQSQMSNVFKYLESFGKSNGKKWSQIWKLLLYELFRISGYLLISEE